jgi:sulfate transport system permease protein
MRILLRRHSVLPGFGLRSGSPCCTSLVVLIPLSAAFVKTATMSWPRFVETVTAPRVLASYRLTFGASLVAALLNGVFGCSSPGCSCATASPGKRIVDALVDLPFALPTAVAGIALTALYAPNGWLGSLARTARHQGRVHAARRARRADLHRPAVRRAHRAAGARRPRARARGSRGHASARRARRSSCVVILPTLTGRRCSPASRSPWRARIGEYGSVIFIAGNMPMVSEIAPLMIITKLEQYDYAGATAIAVVMLLISFTLLLAINLLQCSGRAAAPA